ncbi:MAG: Branched-chain amino acid aminotransferase/4-amino-4-deoxychorismate lyase [Candidatus Woesebacteria bacterium GW2011_GWB1_39_12]|uniref:Branched-chain amino acid aminotransferase/4-amino-4-deoxychorismate lyase n=2 Tax=Candidatus Woeseibacteriota TaxID=1752722 RepID=A0A0G0LZH2_9BACT|nr:MAG: Branched-chain amino acid aminotransferase/4-amino-4-deoxychorismate lyase [Candidatus Woesebacteria bacterium GW2011_GWA1_39_12]KKR00410.1 MAG: Branched-chain amino acid aminotransferase/4-amino-4-deoxychorismate lyase [Candidatus Woesebacteria bacterium GW2011_GWB1_39_12]
MKKQEPIYYLNGKFVAKSKAKISLWDLGFLRGYGVFDYIVTYKGGKPFLLKKHLKRLNNSAKIIGLKIPWSSNTLEKLIVKTLFKNKNGKEKIIRIIVTGGETMDGISLGSKPTLAIMVYDRKRYPASLYKRGVNVITFNYNRESPQAKSLNYIQAVKAMNIAKKKKAAEAVYVYKNLDKVYEGTQSSLFIIKKGTIFTPDGETLPGITRELINNICKKFYPTFMKEVKIDELFNADEVFLSASNKEILPVVKVDNKVIGNGKPGDITKQIMSEFRKFVESGRW